MDVRRTQEAADGFSALSKQEAVLEKNAIRIDNYRGSCYD